MKNLSFDKPKNPRFSCGPTKKPDGWSFKKINKKYLGRYHRADDVKEFIKFAISNSDLDRDEVLAFIKDAKPSKKAVVLKNNQPEVKATWDSYRNTRVSATRIINGLKFLLDHKILLENVEKDFGVSKFYIVSIIGIETNYGRNYGSFNPLDAIFTRAFDPKSKYWQNELLELFKIAKRYNLQPKNMRSSW